MLDTTNSYEFPGLIQDGIYAEWCVFLLISKKSTYRELLLSVWHAIRTKVMSDGRRSDSRLRSVLAS